MKQPKPGIYKMSMDEYKSIDAVNNSTLVRASKTLAHVQAQKKETRVMSFGQAFHSYLLENHLFKRDYAIIPYNLKLTKKAGKAWLKDHGDKNIVKSDDAITMANMASSLYSGNYETARNLVEKSEKEISVIWRHKKEGVLCKARFDLLSRKLGIIADVKTSTNANPDKWLRMMVNAGIQPFFQPFWYLEGCKSIPELSHIKTFLWVVIEADPPYGISIIKATPVPDGKPSMVYASGLKIASILQKYIQAKNTNKWVGYPDKIIDLKLEEWMFKKLEI